jgi:hypothetical protein
VAQQLAFVALYRAITSNARPARKVAKAPARVDGQALAQRLRRDSGRKGVPRGLLADRFLIAKPEHNRRTTAPSSIYRMTHCTGTAAIDVPQSS